VRRNPQHISLLTVVSVISTPPFQPLHYKRNVCCPVVNRFMRQTLPTVNRKHFFVNILVLSPFGHKYRTTEHCSSVIHSSRAVTNLPTEISLCTCASCLLLLPRLSWYWTVLLPSDTYRKPIIYITNVLLPFVTYLLILPRTYVCLVGNCMRLPVHTTKSEKIVMPWGRLWPIT
jgi:hypothetical protein